MSRTLSPDVRVQYLGHGFPVGPLLVPTETFTFTLHHMVAAGDTTPPFRFGFSPDFSVAVCTGPSEPSQAFLERVLPPLRQGAFLETQGHGPQHYKVT